jgi:hypothetical protein
MFEINNCLSNKELFDDLAYQLCLKVWKDGITSNYYKEWIIKNSKWINYDHIIK